jgi:hypothetical protein
MRIPLRIVIKGTRLPNRREFNALGAALSWSLPAVGTMSAALLSASALQVGYRATFRAPAANGRGFLICKSDFSKRLRAVTLIGFWPPGISLCSDVRADGSKRNLIEGLSAASALIRIARKL